MFRVRNVISVIAVGDVVAGEIRRSIDIESVEKARAVEPAFLPVPRGAATSMQPPAVAESSRPSACSSRAFFW